jgi:Flp pilus assembly protein TadB
VRNLRAASLLGVLLALGALAVAALLAVYVPLKLLSIAGERKLDSLTAGFFAFMSIVAGGAIAHKAIGVGYRLVTKELTSELDGKLTAYRARQRAMLEELDAVKRLLEEIRDLLKEGVGA